MTRRRLSVPSAAALLALAACSRDATAPRKPASLAPGSSAAISATVGTALVTPPTFSVLDASGNAIADVAVTVTVVAGGGTVLGAPTRTQNGPTPVGTWILGTTAGINVVMVTVSGLPALSITATGTADAPSTLTVVLGDAQQAPANAPVPSAIWLKVGDQYDNGVPNTPVTFTVINGGGFLSGSTSATSDLNGLVMAPAWTLGRTAAAQRLLVSAGGVGTLVSATVATSFRAEVRFFGPPVDPVIEAAFTKARERVEGMVTGDIPDAPLVGFNAAVTCGATGTAPMTEDVDDVVIFATITTIDGPGRVLGSAGPCYIRSVSDGGLTIVGLMRFDVADLQNLASSNRLDGVILHEMMHVLGFGTLWQLKGLSVNPGTAATAFIGAQAITGCVSVGGGDGVCLPSIPLENIGSPGTIDGHWRESIFDRELMTGIAEAPGVPTPLSLMSILSLVDLGYTVNPTVNDLFTLGSSSVLLDRLRAARAMEGPAYIEELLLPRFEAVPGGGMRRLPEKR